MAKKSKADQKLITAVRRAAPYYKHLPVLSPDPVMNMYFLELSRVCYITTRNAMDSDNADNATDDSNEGLGEIVFVCHDGNEYSSHESLKSIQDKLEVNGGNPWFMRTSNSHIINLARIKGTRINNARDVFFEGIDEPVINAVTRTYFDKFKTYAD